MLWIRLQGEPIAGGGVAMTASGASYGPAAFPDAYVGKIVALEGTRIALALNGQTSRLALVVDLQFDSGDAGRPPGPCTGAEPGVSARREHRGAGGAAPARRPAQ